MPRKPKSRKPAASPDRVWVAPRPAGGSEPRTSDKVWIAAPTGRSEIRTFEPGGIGPSNRYLEFADIALGVKEIPRRTEKPSSAERQPRKNKDRKNNVTSIDSPRPLKQRFGAFRNSR